MYQQTLQSLDYKNYEYLEKIDIWQQIKELYEGGDTLEKVKSKYLPMRPGEPLPLYKIRLEKFTYNNNISLGINTLCNKLATGSLNVKDTNNKQLQLFRENINGKGTQETEYINELFRQLLLFGKVYLHIDKPKTDYEVTTALDEQTLDLIPYITSYSVEQVLDWNDDFIKVKQQFTFRDNPFDQPKIKQVWSYITVDKIIRYEQIIEINKSESINKDTNKDDKKLIEPIEIIEHGYGELPVKIFELKPELWLTKLVFHKLKEALRLENYITDALSIGTHLQRTYKPYQSSLNESDFYNENNDDIQTGNTTVIKVDDFKIVEMTGSSVLVASKRLAEIERSISIILTAKGSDQEYKEYGNNSSGVSKRIDFSNQEASLITYGKKLREFYQEILNLVVKIMGIDDVPYVYGFNSFELDTVTETLLLAQGVKTVHEFLPEIALKAFSKRFSKLIMDTKNQQELNELQSQIDKIDFRMSLPIKEVNLAKELASDNTF